MLALDVSLKKSGWATEGQSGVIVCPNRFQSGPPQKKAEREQRRLAWWRRIFRELIREHAGGVVWVEAPFIHSQNSGSVLPLGRLHGVLLLAAFDEHAVVHQKDNNQMKAWAHKVEGISTPWPMSKEDMVDVARHLGCDTESDDEADAFLLYRMVS